ncbi:hypothetical protein NC661_03880 [Aquibacillus koreensis]|uniref:Family 2 glycosyl transferase n=1 Tax=Aquibacillus koreensis TaxID=279446 RepID=A0A9X4AH11_9BACI|nr:hypothetical protein [Aquibacillus koreensis]MCT2534889.1 hypothetical protein [Aquibacillus koreensis]MDC3419501.1 hypothetical protein [Aquibacillus koreensis]
MTNKKGLFIGVFLLVLLFSSPVWLWQLKGSEEVNVLIVDKTVPDQTYREHKGLVWLLNHLKVKQAVGKAYDVQEDYVGFVPTDQPPEFEVRELPDDLSAYDLLYVADGYGVYQDEYTGNNQNGARSELLYGGMTADEVTRIRSSLIENHQTLIAEFNTFGSPTEQHVREGFYDLLNVRWSGWMGRYFVDLQNNEVPIWLKQNFEKQYGESYDFEGSGLVFVHENDQVVVITDDELSGDDAVTFEPTEEALDLYDIDKEIAYNYWFDIVEAGDQEEVQADFNLHLSKSAEKQLTENEIPLTFPAVIHHENQSYDSYYFAGDFADQEQVPSMHGLSGIAWLQKQFAFDKAGRTDLFYWKAYVPVMKEIVLNLENERKEEAVSTPDIKVQDDMKYTGQSGENYLQVYKNGEWQDILVKGVNMGIAKPGAFPGETKITRAEYARWFEQISEMNANAIRVYTIHPPGFYQALYEHNQNSENPLYLFHGVWVNEEILVEKQNAYDPEVTEEFKAEIKRIIDIVNGNASIEARPGHASGEYVHDLSPYLLGWVIGIEWDPNVVVATNDKNPNKAAFDGNYFTTDNASPFENWLAEMMDFTATYEAENYQWQHPMSFTNWVTTDLLTHPAEPSEEEDMVSVDPNKIKAKDAFYPGQFASYHIYPYYPDFLNYEKKYVEYLDHRGEKNNYAGYLNDMKQHHNMPLLVAEFGIPASRGLTHENVYGLDQGHHSEQEQGQFLSRLFEDIVEEDVAGGLVFTWQDEWFKRTWNTMDYDNPDRRPFWDNIQTNEQHFGLLSFEPGTKEKQYLVDGDTSDWRANDAKPMIEASNGPIKNVYMASDERALYFRIDFEDENVSLADVNTSILLNTIPDQGQSSMPNVVNLNEQGIDFLVDLNGQENANVLIDSYYDTFYYHYGHVLNMIPQKDYASERNNGVYHPIRLALNKELTIERPDGAEIIPFSAYETGELLYGNGNPADPDSNTLADFFLKDGTLEIRLPWLLLNVKDPSQKQLMGDIWGRHGLDSSVTVDQIAAKIITTNANNKVMQKVPATDGEWIEYSWSNWQEPTYHERLKKSYGILRDTFREINLK